MMSRCFTWFSICSILKTKYLLRCGQYTQFNYKIKSRESAKNRPVLDDLLDTCKSYLVQAKVELLKVVVHLGQKSSAFKERYAHLSSEETLETGKLVSK